MKIAVVVITFLLVLVIGLNFAVPWVFTGLQGLFDNKDVGTVIGLIGAVFTVAVVFNLSILAAFLASALTRGK